MVFSGQGRIEDFLLYSHSYISFCLNLFSPNSVAGCNSYLGRIGGQQALSLQRNGCIHKSEITREFVMAAGIGPENNRPDRDNFVKILVDNIPPGNFMPFTLPCSHASHFYDEVDPCNY